MKRVFSWIFIIAIIISCSACNNAELKQLQKENAELKQQLSEQGNNFATSTPKPESLTAYKAKFKDNNSNILENDSTVVKILDEIIIAKDTSNEYDVVLNFEFTNKTNEGHNFNSRAYLSLYQNGLELDSLLGSNGYIEDENIYDSQPGYKKIKDGATLKVQRAFKISDLNGDIDVDLSLLGNVKSSKVIQIYK